MTEQPLRKRRGKLAKKLAVVCAVLTALAIVVAGAGWLVLRYVTMD
ncbi:MAG TPA: hypothetical protein VLK85_11340 [Ramlibacter sp.]|nr:hypothetical protein [Ramlibacter sp.]